MTWKKLLQNIKVSIKKRWVKISHRILECSWWKRLRLFSGPGTTPVQLCTDVWMISLATGVQQLTCRPWYLAIWAIHLEQVLHLHVTHPPVKRESMASIWSMLKVRTLWPVSVRPSQSQSWQKICRNVTKSSWPSQANWKTITATCRTWNLRFRKANYTSCRHVMARGQLRLRFR